MSEHAKVPGSETSENAYLGVCWCQTRDDAWPCRTTTSLRPVDSDPNRGRRRNPVTFFPAADLLGLNDEPVDSGGRRRETTSEGEGRG